MKNTNLFHVPHFLWNGMLSTLLWPWILLGILRNKIWYHIEWVRKVTLMYSIFPNWHLSHKWHRPSLFPRTHQWQWKLMKPDSFTCHLETRLNVNFDNKKTTFFLNIQIETANTRLMNNCATWDKTFAKWQTPLNARHAPLHFQTCHFWFSFSWGR